MAWTQVYDPMGGAVWSALVAGIPLISLFYMLAVRRAKGHYAAGLADALKTKASDSILARNKSTSTQTNKSRFDRWTNVNSIFIPGKDFYKIENSHVLLVDDIVTTGATLEACADVLIQYGKAKVSVASIAFTN